MLYHTFSTQEEIDREYNPRFSVENTDELIQSYLTESKRVSGEYANLSGVAYGVSPEETLDIYSADISSSPIHIFFHGGYWHSLSSRDFSFMAEGLVRNGITAVLVNYALCPAVTIDEIVRQARSAVAWIFHNAESIGGNPERITVSGHSAGGHLTGMLLSVDWKKDFNLPPNILKGLLSFSGLFDLTPFPFSWLQPKLQLSSAEVLRNSPLLLKPKCAPPVTLAVGADESNEFHRQSKNYSVFLKKNGVPANYLSIHGKNHFNIIHDFLGDGGPLCKQICAWS
jgi:arylformamidase